MISLWVYSKIKKCMCHEEVLAYFLSVWVDFDLIGQQVLNIDTDSKPKVFL